MSRREILGSSSTLPSTSVADDFKLKSILKVSRFNKFEFKSDDVHLQEKLLLDEILRPSSRRHLTDGVGDPRAWHDSVKSLPSRTITSELLVESSIVGGTFKFMDKR